MFFIISSFMLCFCKVNVVNRFLMPLSTIVLKKPLQIFNLQNKFLNKIDKPFYWKVC